MRIFNRLFRRAHAPSIDCDTVMRQLWDYLDGELTADRAAAIRQHVEMCSRCKPQTDFEAAFLEAVKRTRREHPQPERLRGALLEALAKQGFASS
ncbi:MAG: zf-HC2 domain-containing protein [Gemmatimonadaceae bacterium]